MNDNFKSQLLSLLPDTSSVVTPPMAIETTYHGPRSYDLLLLNSSYADQSLETVIKNTLFAALADVDCDCHRNEQVDFLAWHLVPMFSEQLSWLQVPGGAWSRFVGPDLIEEWFVANQRYCLLVQAFDRQGEVMRSKLSWLKSDAPESAADDITDQVYGLDEKEAAMFSYSVYNPRLAAAFAMLRPHPAWTAPDLGADE